MKRITEHQEAWWGTQPCRRCNPLGLPAGRPTDHLPGCLDCDGSGWTVWAALAHEPWSEIVPGLWVGGHDYCPVREEVLSKGPQDTFETVVSMYHRPGFEPDPGVEHILVQFPDAAITPEVRTRVLTLGSQVAERVRSGRSVLVRCQAGLNRSSLVAGVALVDLGYQGRDAIQLLRSRRSPWALCNETYADFIASLSEPGAMVPETMEEQDTQA